MKTAFGYLFLALSATFAGLLVFSIVYAATGKLGPLLAMQDYQPHNWAQLAIYWFIHVAVIFPLGYYGFKWIKREENYPTPPTGGVK